MIGAYIDTKEVMGAYRDAFQRLARMSGFDHRTVLRAESGSILKQWAGRTKVSTVAKVDRASRLHSVRSLGYTGKGQGGKGKGEITVNAGFNAAPFGRVWVRVRAAGGRKSWLLARGANFSAPSGTGVFDVFRNRKKPHPTTNFWIEEVIDAQTLIQEKLPKSISKGRRSMNLARQSVVQIADSLNIDLMKVPGTGLNSAGLKKAKDALATTGVYHRNGTSAQGGNEVRAYVDLINRLPYGVETGMDRVLVGVVAGRAKFIEQAYAKGAFDNMKNTAKSFPGLFTVTTNY
jgi:hypothetical protein